MRYAASIFFAVAMVLICKGSGMASLIGDTVVIGHHGPYIDDVALSETVTVEAGSGDLVTLGSFSVDMEADFLTVSFNKADSFKIFNFNGLVISDLNDDGGDDYILMNAAVQTDVAGWDDSRIIIGDDYAGFNWSGLAFNTTTEFAATLEFGPNPIPIPASLLLFITGVIGFAALRKLKTAS